MRKPCSKDVDGAIVCSECNGTGIVPFKESESNPDTCVGCFTCSSSRFRKGTGYIIEINETDITKQCEGSTRKV